MGSEKAGMVLCIVYVLLVCTFGSAKAQLTDVEHTGESWYNGAESNTIPSKMNLRSLREDLVEKHENRIHRVRRDSSEEVEAPEIESESESGTTGGGGGSQSQGGGQGGGQGGSQGGGQGGSQGGSMGGSQGGSMGGSLGGSQGSSQGTGSQSFIHFNHYFRDATEKNAFNSASSIRLGCLRSMLLIQIFTVVTCYNML